MKYYTEINGWPVCAGYTQENIDEIFLPMLRHLTEMQRAKGKRILVMLAAPPAAGKSTLAEFLAHLAKTTLEIHPVTVIGMDGFHCYQEDLLSHTIIRDGEEVSLVKIKGAPCTFDVEKLENAIRQVASGADCGWPQYSRPLHNPVENAIQVAGDIVLLEGNYLLLDQDVWRDLHGYADYTIMVTADPGMLRERLISRRMAGGDTYKQAEEFVDFSDMPNARLCLEHSLKADLQLQILADGSYKKK